jgi:NADPH:quinone reductase-like Zn-dependent oxidoreductase
MLTGTALRIKEIAPLKLNVSSKLWFDKLLEVGFDYGDSFRVVSRVSMNHKDQAVSCKATVRKTCDLMIGESPYTYHPGTLDSCLQSTIFAVYSGKLNSVTHGFMPTEIKGATLRVPQESDYNKNTMKINTWVAEGGSRSFVVNSQLTTEDGRLLMDFHNIHIVAYEAVVPQLPTLAAEAQPRQPYFSSAWKPDISLLGQSSKAGLYDIVDWALHKNPESRILDIEGIFAAEIRKRYINANITVSKEPIEFPEWMTSIKSLEVDPETQLPNLQQDQLFDLIISSETLDILNPIASLYKPLLSSTGTLVAPASSDGTLTPNSDTNSSTSDWVHVREGLNMTVVSSPGAIKKQPFGIKPLPSPVSKAVTVIKRAQLSSLARKFVSLCQERGNKVACSTLESSKVQFEDQVVILMDANEALLTDMNEAEWTNLQAIIRSVSKIFWVTIGGVSSSQSPDQASVFGLARVLRAENSGLQLVTVDVEPDLASKSRSVDLLSELAQAQLEGQSWLESEYAIVDGNLCINRIVPAEKFNNYLAPQKADLYTVPFDNQLHLKGVNHDKQLCFQLNHEPALLGEHEVEIKVLAAGLSESDAQAFTGRSYRSTWNHETSGIVSKIGTKVTGLNVGDAVVGFAFDTLSTFQRTPAALLARISRGSYEATVSLITPFVTAMYGLNELARIEEGETVLILANSGPVVFAALQVCHLAGANYLIVTDSLEDRQKLIKYGISGSAIIYPGSNVYEDVKRHTNGSGIDVIFGKRSTNAFQLNQCLSSLAPCARVVLFGSKHSSIEIFDTLFGQEGFDLSVFDILEICEKKPKIISRYGSILVLCWTS